MKLNVEELAGLFLLLVSIGVAIILLDF